METLPENNNSEVEKSTNSLADTLQEVLHLVKKKRATDAMVSMHHERGFSVDVRMGNVETVSFNEDKAISLTLYIGHRKGSASSTDTSPQALDMLVTKAYEIAEVSAADPCFGLADKALMTTTYPDLDLYHPWNITPAEAIQKALTCEHDALSRDKRISNSDGVNVSTHAFCHGFANTHGGKGILNSTFHSISCSLIAQEGESMQRDYDYSVARRVNDLSSIEQIAKQAAERAVNRLGARKLPTQKTPVLFSSRVSNGLFSSFINAISGSNLYRKNSFLLNTLGQQLFPSMLKIHEQPFLLKGIGSSAFDEEGVPTRPNVFVDGGILHQYVLGSYSARKLGLQTTANSGGVHNLTIEPTAGDLSHLLSLMDKGLLVTELMGQGVNGLTGDYSRGASGFWVEGGKIQYPVEEITIAGNLKDMFQSIAAVGSDINPNFATRCGSVLIEEMTLAGH